MYTDFALLALRTRQADSKFYVSAWWIPGGSDYTKPLLIGGFFGANEDDEARAFAKKYGNPPEMATLDTIEEYDAIRVSTYRVAKTRLRNADTVDYRVQKDQFYVEQLEQEFSMFNPTLHEELKKCI